MYHFPLLQIIGVTSIDKLFSTAVAYLESEREENFTWALHMLKSLMDDNIVPEIIMTDGDLALMNATENIFSTAKHLLCRCHIGTDLLCNCKKKKNA